MLTVERKPGPGELVFHFSGQIDETTDFLTIFGNPPGKICLNMRHVTRINSVGIGNWVTFAGRLVSAGIKIRYAECSPSFTNCLRHLIGPANRDAVESVIGTFTCTKCFMEFEKVIRTPDIQTVKPQITGQACTICKAPAEFDDIPAEFFIFLVA